VNAGWAIIMACALVAAPAMAREKPVALLARPDTSHDQREADRAACRGIVDKARGADMPAVDRTIVGAAPGDAGMAGVAGAAIVGLFFAMIEDGKAEARGVTLCMRNRGYVPLILDDAERAAFQATPVARRAEWERRFLSGDLAVRIAEAARPLVPQLPDYHEEPGDIGGLRFDVAGFQVSPTAVAEGGTLLTGTLQRARTAVLAADFASTDGPVTIAGTAGAVFHQVDYRPQREPMLREPGATWCGPVEQRAGGVAAPSVYCLVSGRGGYLVYRPSGFAWLAGPQTSGFALPMLTAPVQLTERPADDLGAIAFSIVTERVRPTGITLVGLASRGNQKVRIWERRLKPGPDGRYVVPLWQRQLVLSVDAALAVRPTLAPGDGNSLRDAE
jgi:hypothetical protein